MTRLLFIDAVHIHSLVYPRYRHVVPHLKDAGEVRLIEVEEAEKPSRFSLLKEAWKADVVFVRNLLSPTTIRGLRSICDRLVFELDFPAPPDMEKETTEEVKKGLKAGGAAKLFLVQGANHLRRARKKILNVQLSPPLLPSGDVLPETGKYPRKGNHLTPLLCEGPSRLLSTINRFEESLARVSERVSPFFLHLRSDSFVRPGGRVQVFFERTVTPFSPPSPFNPEIFLFPLLRGKNDHFGTSPYILNALSQGLACLVPVTEVDRRIFRDGEALLTYRSLEEFEEKLGLLLTDESLRKSLGERGESIARENFSPDVVVRHYRSLVALLTKGERA